MLSNSFISDVQNAGLSFISGGDYTHSSVIKGLWELALKTVFVGQTQPANDPNYAYSSDLGPFNSMTMSKLGCDKPYGAYCVSKDNSLALGGLPVLASASICLISTMAPPMRIQMLLSI